MIMNLVLYAGAAAARQYLYPGLFMKDLAGFGALTEKTDEYP
jgi:hypothetical protein